MTILTEKWKDMLAEEALKPVDSEVHKLNTTAQLLENQDKFLVEASNVTSGVENFDPVLIKLVRRMAPKLIAYDIEWAAGYQKASSCRAATAFTRYCAMRRISASGKGAP